MSQKTDNSNINAAFFTLVCSTMTVITVGAFNILVDLSKKPSSDFFKQLPQDVSRCLQPDTWPQPHWTQFLRSQVEGFFFFFISDHKCIFFDAVGQAVIQHSHILYLHIWRKNVYSGLTSLLTCLLCWIYAWPCHVFYQSLDTVLFFRSAHMINVIERKHNCMSIKDIWKICCCLKIRQ